MIDSYTVACSGLQRLREHLSSRKVGDGDINAPNRIFYAEHSGFSAYLYEAWLLSKNEIRTLEGFMCLLWPA